MVKMVLLCAAVLAFGSLICRTHGVPIPDEERYFEKEINREFVNWLNALQYPQQLGNNHLCKYYSSNFLGSMPKRNSELINSLLSLPKSMNDAGK